ncbi:MAG: hypothetical protein ACOX0K_07890 [Oscillospiraceae bacterium]
MAKDYDLAVDLPCMHEFVLGLSRLKKETGVSAMDVAKAMLDYGMHPPPPCTSPSLCRRP